MKILKKIGIGILAIIVLALVVALFLPKDFTISATVTVNKPQKEVFEYVKQIKNQEQYSVWILGDKTTKLTYTGEDGTVGFNAAWKGESAGEGSQTITEITNEKVAVDLHFLKPMKDEQKAATIVKAIDDKSCTLTNEFYNHSSWPGNLMANIFARKFVGDAQLQNMNNVKAILEKK